MSAQPFLLFSLIDFRFSSGLQTWRRRVLLLQIICSDNIFFQGDLLLGLLHILNLDLNSNRYICLMASCLDFFICINLNNYFLQGDLLLGRPQLVASRKSWDGGGHLSLHKVTHNLWKYLSKLTNVFVSIWQIYFSKLQNGMAADICCYSRF